VQRALDKAALQRRHIRGEDELDERRSVALGDVLELIDEFGLREELSYVHVVTGIDLCCYDGECQAPRLVSGGGHVRIPLAEGVFEHVEIEREVEWSVLRQLMGDGRLAGARRSIDQDHPCHIARLAINVTRCGRIRNVLAHLRLMTALQGSASFTSGHRFGACRKRSREM